MASACPGCGVLLPEVDGPGHRYVNASPACWAAYGQVLAAEYSDPTIFAACHGLSVDAYIAQHPGGGHPVRSVVVHLAGLHLDLERGLDAAAVLAARRRLVDREWVGPDPVAPTRWGTLTVLDLAAAAGGPAHVDRVRSFAGEVWQAWAHEHERIAAFVGTAGTARPASRGVEGPLG